LQQPATLLGLSQFSKACTRSEFPNNVNSIISPTPERSHWQAHADELRGRYGIEVVLCREESIASELPVFLAELVRQVDHLRRTRAAGKQVQQTAEDLVPTETTA
jgi:hypothetical protein